MREKIAIDADDVSFDENTAVRLFHNQAYSASHTEEQYLENGEYAAFWERIWGVDREEGSRRYEAYLQHKVTNGLEPRPDAQLILPRLHKHRDLVLVTKRGQESVEMTHEALETHYAGLFSEVHFVHEWEKGTELAVSKADICKEIGADYLIDDAYEHCSAAAQAKLKQALLFGDLGWNRWQPLLAGMTRVRDWYAVKRYFDGRDESRAELPYAS